MAPRCTGIYDNPEDLVSQPCRKKARLHSPDKTLKNDDVHSSDPLRSFTKADADALCHQMREFEQEYNRDGFEARENLSPKEVELRMACSALLFRIEEIKSLIQGHFYTSTTTQAVPADQAILTLVDYRNCLVQTKMLCDNYQGRLKHLEAADKLKNNLQSVIHEEAAYDGDDESDHKFTTSDSYNHTEYAKRKKWYRSTTEKRSLGHQMVSIEEPGSAMEWEPLDSVQESTREDPAHCSAADDWVSSEHVTTFH
ncbi:hypothetical protein CORC01_01775 [Colletotrichum orchidophilum]|uniref:Uncharacterized protein n=1 Tax=Colletotrichum orchidophilum TaxID=1209926 RepID=A0A1G4BNX0_9PEZI|nr:uncharacterized protein CORC01_01775 [Colletotrichum orchidophilum]OHF03017.1 hypothetical protein CORC01_01775 [Colletotrichum orchidophilum]